MAPANIADSSSINQKLNQTFRLRDGRRLGFAEYGPADGEPMLYFHGWPSSRLEVKLAAQIFYEVGVRVIAIDRPGYGLSDFKARRKLIDWPDDVSELADHLSMKRFGIIGTSGGGPYAAVCGRFLSHRIVRMLLICPLSPLTGKGITDNRSKINRLMVLLASRTPRVAQMVSGLCLEYVRRLDCVVFPPRLETTLGEADRRALAQPMFRNLLLESSREAFRQGVRGASWDACLYARPWGFSLEDIDAPVYVWHGESDRIVPVSNGKRYAATIPKCRSFFFEEDGHFSLPFNRIRDIISAVRS